ncbi:alpha/beta fold hydrolase [Bacteriovorax sp. DB6_IX]|uniref:alpha/beta fold hydrolase n=1 Tax=Bacteriovorax sp. DB6_IX TaxID=1353530 RepID=UPI00038A4DFE|nr:alpha/beta hydrolase [Bacteriovorax sp. DB6_IX]EQC51833.1 putative lysophospholipase [Bacteriovorax sp. DB6_IX]
MKQVIEFPKPKMIKTNSIELEVFEAGDPNKGKPIILCHGWPEHAYSWRYQIPALVEAGFHVIVPNQRGFGNSSCPKDMNAYDIENLSRDLIGLLDHYGYDKATFVGHDWGAGIIWWLSQLYPQRVERIINMALPYQERGERPWLEMMEEFLGENYYFVHFKKYPGVADQILDENTSRFLQNLFRKNIPLTPLGPEMMMIKLAKTEQTEGVPIMSEKDLSVFVTAFKKTGFGPGINWYRNLDRNWQLLADVDPIIKHPTLMIYGTQDTIPRFERLKDFVPLAQEVSLDCGHWIQQELPEKTNEVILSWLWDG